MGFQRIFAPSKRILNKKNIDKPYALVVHYDQKF